MRPHSWSCRAAVFSVSKRDNAIPERDLRSLSFRSLAVYGRAAERRLHRAREISLGIVVAAFWRRAPCGAAGSISIGAARPAGHAALSARLRHPGLRVSRPAADHAAKPHAGALRYDRHGGVAAPDRLRQRHRGGCGRRALSLCNISRCSVRAAGLWQISLGRAVEPAAAISRFATAVGERLARAAES